MYSKCLQSKDLRQRLLAESTNVLLRRYPLLRVAYLDSAAGANYSVLIRGGCSDDDGVGGVGAGGGGEGKGRRGGGGG